MVRNRTPSPEMKGAPAPQESWYQDVEKVLKLEGGVFIPRSSRFEKERGRRIDGGWKARLVQVDKSEPPVIAAEKERAGEKDLFRQGISIKEVIRLNTGRNRGALEYVFKGADTPGRTDLINAVDRADDNAQAREKLTEFFRKEALAKAQTMFERTPVKLRARTFEEMMDEIGEHLHEVEDAVRKSFQEITNQAEADEAETQWKNDVQELFSLIDLSGQFKG